MREGQLIHEYGRKKTGKTRLAMHKAALRSPRVAVFDPSGEYDVTIIPANGEDLDAAWEAGFTPLIYRAEGDDVREDFSKFARMVWRAGDCVAVINEASELQSSQSVHPELSRLCRMGRHVGIDVITTQHVMRDTYPTLHSIADHLIFFRLTLDKDLKRISEVIGDRAAEEVSRLPNFHYLDWNVPEENFYVVGDPASWKNSIGLSKISSEDRIEERISRG